MSPLDFANHLLGFAAPALAVAVLLAMAGRWLLTKQSPLGWIATVGINFIAGLAALGAGLWYFGRDGKMATYAALVLAAATAQWIAGRGWRG